MKAGILTFHASHNHGSVLQAYATQRAIERLGYQAQIVNYRLPTQKQKYSLYSTQYGMREYVRSLAQLPIHNGRARRHAKFEDFIRHHLKTTQEFSSLGELEQIKEKFDIFVSGSDQIWNSNVPEIKSAGSDSILPYFLSFTEKKKISYSSCTGDMTREEMLRYLPLLRRYSKISVRERETARLLSSLLGTDIESVLDPSFLLGVGDWEALMPQRKAPEREYVLLYSILGASTGRNWLKELLPFSKRHGLDIVCITPFFPILSPNVKNVVDAGPEDFLFYIRNASVVCTDSFHGTAFSLIFHRPFFALGDKYWKGDSRRADLLQKLDLTGRLIQEETEINLPSDYRIDYALCEDKIEEEVRRSIFFLKDAMEN